MYPGKVPMNIMLAQEDDLDQIYQVECDCFSRPWSKKSLWGDLVSPQTLCLVAKEAGVVVGFCFLSVVADEGTVLQLAVMPSFRRKGTGRALVEHAISRAKAREVSYVMLEVRVTNAPARRLYESLGFQELGVRKEYYQDNKEDALMMILRME